MTNSNIVSVVVLKERLINNKRIQNTPLFEESIYLINLDMNNKTKKQLLDEIYAVLKKIEIDYENEYGEKIKWKVYKIIDVFDSIYNLDTTEFPNEVYSRHLELPEGTEYSKVISMFYSDYVWEDSL